MLVIVAAAAVGFYAFRHQGSSDNVKSQMRGVIGDMDLPPAWHEEALLLLEAAHEKAFTKALDVTRKHGRKFDVDVYYQEVFDLMIAWAREDGKAELADRLDNDRTSFILRVREW